MKKGFFILMFFTLISMILPINTKAVNVNTEGGSSTNSVAVTCQYKLYASGYSGNPTMTMIYTLYTDGTLKLPFDGKAIIKDGKWDAGGGFFDSLSFYAHEDDFANKFKKIANPSTGKYLCPYLEDSGWDTSDGAYIIKVSDTAGKKMVLEKEQVSSEQEKITEKTKCEYYIKERLTDKEPITKASSSGSIKVVLAMDSTGRKYFYVQNTKSNYIKSGEDGLVQIIKTGSNNYGTSIRFVLKSSETSALYKQNFQQMEHNQFSCPTQLYVIYDKNNNYDPNKSSYIEDYIISSSAGDTKASLIFNATKTGYTNDGYESDENGNTVDSKTGKPLDCSAFVDNGVNLISEIFGIIMIAAPILVIVLGSLDFAKASLAQDENALKKAGTNFGKRLIAAVLLFILPLIINLILGLAFDAGVFGDNEVPKICLEDQNTEE